MHRFNIRNNTIQDCDLDGETILEAELPQLTVEENIRIYGGDIVYEDIKPGTTPFWDFRGDFARHLRERAKDMNIRLVEKIQDMDDADLQKTIRTFWTG